MAQGLVCTCTDLNLTAQIDLPEVQAPNPGTIILTKDRVFGLADTAVEGGDHI